MLDGPCLGAGAAMALNHWQPEDAVASSRAEKQQAPGAASDIQVAERLGRRNSTRRMSVSREGVVGVVGVVIVGVGGRVGVGVVE